MVTGQLNNVHLFLEVGASPGVELAFGMNLLHLCAALPCQNDVFKALLDAATSEDINHVDDQ